MCGIAGYSGKKKISKDLIINTLNLMKKRGPDSQNFFFKKNKSNFTFLLHSRLSIIDIDNRSNQPFSKYGHTIVFNGEIYNFLELKRKIEKNTSFQTSSDTEIILEYYNLFGEKCVNYFEGMWSFVIYDGHKKTMFVSRDRFGEKPLYTHFDNSGFYFASEIKFIKALKDTDLEINYELVNNFLGNGYKCLFKKNTTFFKNIFRLNNSTSLIIK